MLYVFVFFFVLVSLLTVILIFNKKQIENFRLLNCKLSKSDTLLSDEDYICCEAKNKIDVLNENDRYYKHYKSIFDSCNMISSIDMSETDPLLAYNVNTHFRSLEAYLNTLVTNSNVLKISYDDLKNIESNLNQTLENRRLIYSNSNITNVELARSNSNLENISSLLPELGYEYEYHNSLELLEDVINKETNNFIGLDQGIMQKEQHLHELIQTTLNSVMLYIPKLSNLYIDSTHLWTSIAKTFVYTDTLMYTDSNRSAHEINIQTSIDLYEYAMELLQDSENTLFKISNYIKDLLRLLYQTEQINNPNERDLNVNIGGITYTLSLNNDEYSLPYYIQENDTYIDVELFNNCTLETMSCNIDRSRLDSTNLNTYIVAQSNKIRSQNNTSSFIYAFNKLNIDENNINSSNSLKQHQNQSDIYFKKAFLKQTF